MHSVSSYETPVREKTDVITRILTETKNAFELYFIGDRIEYADVRDNVDLLIKESLKLEQLLGETTIVSHFFSHIKVLLFNMQQKSINRDSDMKLLFIDSVKKSFSDAYKQLFFLKRKVNKVSDQGEPAVIEHYNKVNRIFANTSQSFKQLISQKTCACSILVPLDRVVEECESLKKNVDEKEKDAIIALSSRIKQMKHYIINYLKQDQILDDSSDTLLRMKNTVLNIGEEVHSLLIDVQQKVNNRIKKNHEHMFHIIDEIQVMMIISMFSGIIIAFLAAFITSRLLMKPITLLVIATQKWAKGNLNYRINISSRDEIGQLIIALNNMASDLQNITVSRDKLIETQAQLVQASKLASIGELASGIAHELNQPLMVIRTGIQMIERTIQKDKINIDQLQDDMTMMNRNTKRMMNIINHLRVFSRQSNTDFEAVDIHQVIEDALSMISEQFRLKNIAIHKTFFPDLPHIKGSANQLEQVILNLMTNARDAIMDKNDVNKSVDIKTECSESRSIVNVFIKDSGKGIPSDHMHKIFDPFYTTKDVGKGTGLGLSISYGIIKEHQGEIIVSETGDCGTTFVIKLPAKAVKSEINS